MVEHFDLDGKPCRAADAFKSVVSVEAEWDEATRERALRLEEYEASTCQQCGLQLEVCRAKGQSFKVHEAVCGGARAIARVRRQRATEAEQDGADDGIRLWVEPYDND